MAQNAADCMSFLFPYDRCELSLEDMVKIYSESYA